MDKQPNPQADSESLIADSYLAGARTAKTRRLSALIVLCALLLGVLVLIYINDWYAQSGGGAGWVFCGIVVALCAIGGVLIDIFYRKDL
jgi:hypothetical protein